jgi:hypothetical protein
LVGRYAQPPDDVANVPETYTEKFSQLEPITTSTTVADKSATAVPVIPSKTILATTHRTWPMRVFEESTVDAYFQ